MFFFGARSGRDMDAVHGASDRYGVWYIGTVRGYNPGVQCTIHAYPCTAPMYTFQE